MLLENKNKIMRYNAITYIHFDNAESKNWFTLYRNYFYTFYILFMMYILNKNNVFRLDPTIHTIDKLFMQILSIVLVYISFSYNDIIGQLGIRLFKAVLFVIMYLGFEVNEFHNSMIISLQLKGIKRISYVIYYILAAIVIISALYFNMNTNYDMYYDTVYQIIFQLSLYSLCIMMNRKTMIILIDDLL